MISQTTIDAVHALNIYDVVSRYNDITLKKSGQNWKANSPWSNENTPSFYVVKSKNIFKDFSTGKGGGPVRFVMEKDGLTWIDAVKSLCEQHGITIEYDKNTDPKVVGEESTAAYQKKADIREALDWACAHFCANELPESFTKYRSFPDDEKLAPFKLGYAKASWDDLVISARMDKDKIIPDETLILAGLAKKSEGGKVYDAFRDRIMFPIFSYMGNVVAFTARDARDYDAQPLKEGEEKPAKYINSPESTWDKSKNLYGLYQAIKGGRLKEGAYLVEGPTDVLRWHLNDITNTVAPCGSALTEDQAKIIKRHTDKLIIVPDNDADKADNPGLKALHRNAQVAIKAGLTVKVLIPGSKV